MEIGNTENPLKIGIILILMTIIGCGFINKGTSPETEGDEKASWRHIFLSRLYKISKEDKFVIELFFEKASSEWMLEAVRKYGDNRHLKTFSVTTAT